jgi:DNA processing protein
MFTDAQQIDRAIWVAISGFFGGPRMKKLWQNFSNGLAVWQSTANELIHCGFQADTAQKFIGWRQKIEPEACLNFLADQKIKYVLFGDPDYPEALLNLPDAPTLLFYKGNLPKSKNFLGIVGTRRATAYARLVALTMSRSLAASGLVIISGLARGIDSIAHEAALEQGGQTLGVIGSGLDRASFYPPENWSLAENIIVAGGGILSEYPPGTEPAQHHFPERNRIIAGLSRGVLVIEAPLKSGALITAYQALEYGREVMAVPGQITEPNSAGTNRLLKLGAHLITEATDITSLLNIESTAGSKIRSPKLELDAESLKILSLFYPSPLTIEEAANNSGLSAAKILMTVSELELKGMLRDTGGRCFVSLVNFEPTS